MCGERLVQATLKVNGWVMLLVVSQMHLYSNYRLCRYSGRVFVVGTHVKAQGGVPGTRWRGGFMRWLS